MVQRDPLTDFTFLGSPRTVLSYRQHSSMGPAGAVSGKFLTDT